MSPPEQWTQWTELPALLQQAEFVVSPWTNPFVPESLFAFETRFGRRLQRACLECAGALIRDPALHASRDRVFRYSAKSGDLSQVLFQMQAMLLAMNQGASEEMESALMSMPRMSSLRPRLEAFNLPVDMEWLTSQDVEEYLSKRGVTFHGDQVYADFVADEPPSPVSSVFHGVVTESSIGSSLGDTTSTIRTPMAILPLDVSNVMDATFHNDLPLVTDRGGTTSFTVPEQSSLSTSAPLPGSDQALSLGLASDLDTFLASQDRMETLASASDLSRMVSRPVNVSVLFRGKLPLLLSSSPGLIVARQNFSTEERALARHQPSRRPMWRVVFS